MTSSSSTPAKRFRSACDRCHGLKLRCIRSSDFNEKDPSSPCSRCKKAGAPCIASERGKCGRPTKASKFTGDSSPPLSSSDEASARGQNKPGLSTKMNQACINQEQKQFMNMWQADLEASQLLFDLDDTSFSHGSPITTPFQSSGGDLCSLPFLCLDGNEHMQLSTTKWPNPQDKLYTIESSTQSTPPSTNDDDSPSRYNDITCLQRLSRLNLKVLDSLQRCISEVAGLQGRIDVNDVMADAIEFSGELIDIMRQLLPRISDAIDVECKSNRHDSLLLDPSTIGLPESTVIFSLLGCYAQILHYFEEVLCSLSSRHSQSIQLDKTALPTVKPLLGASLFANIVEHLLNKVQKEFSLRTTDGGLRDTLQVNNEDDVGIFSTLGLDPQRSFLDRALVETRKQEYYLGNKARELQRILCES